ncbi:MAG TPA: threonine-phosphate decarboxylase CobD [Desulfatiglandales bacterium]|nr:threonine-phosphate decarboxylase CobD [Desulfatiglandales bacterium]
MDIKAKDDGPPNGHRHGGNPLKDMARLGLPNGTVIDFSTSINPLGIPPVIKDHWSELVESVRDYPTIEGDGIAGFYRDRFGISPENVLAGNGSTEVIYLLARVLHPNRVLVIAPSFHDYYRASVLSGADVAWLPLTENKGFSSLNTEVLSNACKGVDAVWIGRPNNPTGSMLPRELLSEISRRFSDKWFILDEAFIQFTDNWEEEGFLLGKRPSNMIIIHSLTKFYSIAGLRMGGVIGSGEFISRMRQSKEPWTINGVAERAAGLLKECAGYEAETRSYISCERKRVVKRLEEIEGIRTFTSSVNFILCRWERTGELDDLLKHLLSNGVYVRDCRNFPGLEENYFRIGLRTAAEDDQLISIISSFSGE